MPTTGAEHGVETSTEEGVDVASPLPGSGRSDVADVPDRSGPTAIDVVAGIVFDATGERVLLSLRKPDQHQGDRWEFPGGKVEPGETREAALARELHEEIGIVPTASVPRCTLEHAYPEKRVRLHFADVTAFSGEPIGREGQTLRWTALADLRSLTFPDANLPIVEALVSAAPSRLDGRPT